MESAVLAGGASRSRNPVRAVVLHARGPCEATLLGAGALVLKRWQRSGLEIALIASSAGLRSLPDAENFTVVIDDAQGPTSAEHRAHQFGEMMLRLEAGPQDTLAIAHEPTSVAAASALGFRRIAGVDPAGGVQQLMDAGAHSAVESIGGLRFPRALPAALQHLEEIARGREHRAPAVFLDFDGTLAPIVQHPDEAQLEPAMREVVARLARRFPVAVISGRDRDDVRERVDVDGIFYAGSHGLDIAGPGRKFNPFEAAPEQLRALQAAGDALESRLGGISGVVLERKRFSVAVHTRLVQDRALASSVAQAAEQEAAARGLTVRRGKRVRELMPVTDWHKGRALSWLCEELAVDAAHGWVLYAGDDETDEDAFRALGPNGIGLRPGPPVASSLADYHVPDVDGVRRFLEWLAHS